MYLFELKSPTIFRKFIESENQPGIFHKFHENSVYFFHKTFMGMTFILYSIDFLRVSKIIPVTFRRF